MEATVEAWVLMIGMGWGSLTAVPSISTRQECERLAAAMRVADFQCFAYRVAK
jgi:hypothetical protein